eukprot:11449960-Prorocentrum_lima.AAC.1
MTSSLVGSEMCIRDSNICANSPSSFALLVKLEVCLFGFRLSAFFFTAVSYTHLTLPTICSV